jgi:acetyl-CoA acetyltransferase
MGATAALRAEELIGMLTRNDRVRVEIVGVGLHPFGRFPHTDTADLAGSAASAALADAGIDFSAVDIAYYAHVYDQGPSPAGRFLPGNFGLTGVPVVNVENACASGSTAIWQAYWMIATGVVRCALVVGAERVPPGPVTIAPEGDLSRTIGDDHVMANYAMRARRYMTHHGAPIEAIAQVSVKSRRNASLNEFSHHRSEISLEQVLSSRMIADPLTLLQCCPTSEGAAAAVLRAGEGKSTGDAPVLRGVSLRTDRYQSRSVHNLEGTAAAAREAYEMAGLGPADIGIVQVHDAATIGELLRIEATGLYSDGRAWQATVDGETELTGRLPVNTDGGLLSMGHPFGATGIRQLHETVLQLRGAAGQRQVQDASAGMIQCAGAGGVSSVAIITDR